MTEALAPAQKTVTLIPQRIQPLTHLPLTAPARRKVAAYARVSTDSEEQENSYEAQVDYFTNYIRSNPSWDFAGLYADEGISATSTRHREGFNSMIADALAGKIDLIVTKSVSRFARNTVDSLTTIRNLKAHGVEVFFQKENIYTFDGKGELLLTIMSSLAQEESRSISENVTWGIRKSFSDGKVSMPYKSFLGYRKGDNGLPEIVPKEAEIVQAIYKRFLDGSTDHEIARELTARGIPTPRGYKRWSHSTVQSILTNEKYMGDAVLQKTFCTDFLKKTFKKNEGEVPQYYVRNSHPAIVSPEVFRLAQAEMERRKQFGKAYSGTRNSASECCSAFSSRLVCGECGAYFGSKVWHSTDAYRSVIWRCNRKYDGERCKSPHVREEQVKNAFVQVMRQVLAEKEEVVRVCREVLAEVLDTEGLDRQTAKVALQLDELGGQIRRLVEQNAHSSMREEKYKAEQARLDTAYEELVAKKGELERKQADRQRRSSEIGLFLQKVEEMEECLEFDPGVFSVLVDRVVVSGRKKDVRLRFVMKGGREYEVSPGSQGVTCR